MCFQKSIKSFQLIVFNGLFLFVGACASVLPAQEMSNARQTLQTAKAAGAEKYATKTYKIAKDTLDKAANYLNSGDFYNARLLALKAAEHAKKAHLAALNRQKLE